MESQPKITKAFPSDIWPNSADLIANSEASISSLTKVISDFSNLDRAVLLLATVRREFYEQGSNGAVSYSWYGIYYSPDWKECGCVKRVHLTKTTKDFLTLYKGPLPVFCMYTETQTQKKKAFFRGDFKTIDEASLEKLKAFVPHSVWQLTQEHQPYSCEED